MTSAPNRPRVTIVEPLRGLAALAVCWFHFTNGGPLLQPGVLRSTGAYGWLGVEIFFVISAFVIPLSMYRGGYTLRSGWRTFVAKRVTRLDPPYLVAVALSVALAYASVLAPNFAGRPPAFTAPQLLAHLGYLNAFLGYAWVNPVFWTLAIEFQYYVLIALAYGLIAAPSVRTRVGALVALGALGLVPAPQAYLPHFLTVFAVGLATFQHHVGLLGRRAYFVLLAMFAAATWFALGPAVALAAACTALAVTFVRVEAPQPLLFLGTVSYSLYLLHVPLGGRVVNLGSRVAHGALTESLVLAAALFVSLTGAYVMYHLVERPAQRWSASFRYASQASPGRAVHPRSGWTALVPRVEPSRNA